MYDKNSYLTPAGSCFVFGVLRYFSVIKNCVCLLHGPAGCTFFNRGAVLRVNQLSDQDSDIPLIFCTDFNEKDTIFGGITKLKRAIQEIDEQYRPEIIAVINCCVSEVIGEDIENVATRLSDKVKAVIVPVRGAGFRGNHKKGMKEASLILYNRFVKPHASKIKTRTRSINYLGEMNPNNWSITELRSILEGHGIATNCNVPTESSVENLRRLGEAGFNYLVCGSASGKLSKKLKNDFDIPTIAHGRPYMGVKNCRDILLEIFSAFGIESSLPDDLFNDAMQTTKANREYFASKTACIVCGTRRSLGYAAILKELGFSIEYIFAESDEDWAIEAELKKQSSHVVLDKAPQDVLSQVQSQKPDVLMTSLSSLVVPERYILGNQNFYGFAGFKNAAALLRDRLHQYGTLTVSVEEPTGE